MARVIREEMQDKDGNIHYFHTEDCIVFGEDGRNLRETMGNVQFEDYTAEGTEIPDAETALAGITKGKKWTVLFSNIKAFCKGVVLLSKVVDSENITEEGYLMSGKKCSEMFQEVSANIDSVFQSVSSGKASVASAITAKGVTTNADATFATMAANIGKIVVSPKALSGNKSIGTVAQKASVTATINFSTAFATTPTVIATARGYINGTTTWQTLGCTVSSKSKSGFTVSLSNSTSYALTNVIVEWTANA